jgi:hypothetical protein
MSGWSKVVIVWFDVVTMGPCLADALLRPLRHHSALGSEHPPVLRGGAFDDVPPIRRMVMFRLGLLSGNARAALHRIGNPITLHRCSATASSYEGRADAGSECRPRSKMMALRVEGDGSRRTPVWWTCSCDASAVIDYGGPVADALDNHLSRISAAYSNQRRGKFWFLSIMPP